MILTRPQPSPSNIKCNIRIRIIRVVWWIIISSMNSFPIRTTRVNSWARLWKRMPILLRLRRILARPKVLTRPLSAKVLEQYNNKWWISSKINNKRSGSNNSNSSIRNYNSKTSCRWWWRRPSRKTIVLVKICYFRNLTTNIHNIEGSPSLTLN